MYDVSEDNIKMISSPFSPPLSLLMNIDLIEQILKIISLVYSSSFTENWKAWTQTFI